MPKAAGLFSLSKKPPRSRPFEDYYNEWFKTLDQTLLPLLSQSISLSPAQLSIHVDAIHRHFLSYYTALDSAATYSPQHLPIFLHPPWRNHLETPFLFQGELHPYVYTNLLRSLINKAEEECNDSEYELTSKKCSRHYCVCDHGHHRMLGRSNEKPLQIVVAWRNPSGSLISRVEQIERGVRFMVPALNSRVRNAKEMYVERLGQEWAKCEGRSRGEKDREAAISDAVSGHLEELMGVFLDANRLRRNVMTEIMSAMTVYQAALFLQSLAQFLIGLRDPEVVNKFERCKTLLR